MSTRRFIHSVTHIAEAAIPEEILALHEMIDQLFDSVQGSGLEPDLHTLRLETRPSDHPPRRPTFRLAITTKEPS